MKRHPFRLLFAFFSLAILISGCSQNQPPAMQPNPVPTETSLSPSSATAGGAAFTLTVNGSNFVSGSVVDWNGSALTTTFVSASQVTAAVPAADIANPGTAQVTVSNPAPGGGTSSTLTFTINAASNPAPNLTSLSPSSATAGDPAFTLTVNGSNFISSSVVNLNGSARTTTFVSATQVTAAIPASDVAAAGTAQVTVTNPAPGGGTSNALTFTINPPPQPNPPPTATTLSPSSTTAGGSAFTLTVDGSNFISSSVVNWNGSARATTFVSATQVTAAITAADIATAGTAQVTVTNPAPGGGTSSALTFTINAPIPPGVIQIASVATGGTQTNNSSGSSTAGSRRISADGRDVAFLSIATNLVAGDTNGASDIFLADTCNGAAAGCTPSTIRVSVANDGSQGNADSSMPSLSADGRYVAFGSSATNLVPGVTTADEVYVRDTCIGAPTGCTPSTTLASAATDGTPGNTGSFGVAISGDGRFVAFGSGSTNLDPAVTTANQVYVRDTCAGAPSGCTPSTTAVSVATDGTPGTGFLDFSELDISGTGRFVAFSYQGDSLGTGTVAAIADVYVRDTCAGATGCTPSTSRVSVAGDGSAGNGQSILPSISADGRFVAFWSTASNLAAGDTNGLFDVFVRDTCAGATGCTPSTSIVTVATDGTQANKIINTVDVLGPPAISAMGRYIAFASDADTLVAGDTNALTDIFVRDTCGGVPAGCTPSTLRASVAADGTQALGSFGSVFPSISAEGRFVVFNSGASNLVTGDINGQFDVFLAHTGF